MSCLSKNIVLGTHVHQVIHKYPLSPFHEDVHDKLHFLFALEIFPYNFHFPASIQREGAKEYISSFPKLISHQNQEFRMAYSRTVHGLNYSFHLLVLGRLQTKI